MELTLKPAFNFLLIEPTEPADHKGSIIIPESVRGTRAITTGKVLECGPECQNFTTGQVVLFTQHSEIVVEMKRQRFFFVREIDIIAATEIQKEKEELDGSFAMCGFCGKNFGVCTCPK